MDICIIKTTVQNKEEGLRIARSLIQDCFAACVNIIPNISSIYYWKDKIVEDCELILFIKTRKSLFDKVKDEIKKLHSYEVPEILLIPLENSEKTYLSWLLENTTEV